VKLSFIISLGLVLYQVGMTKQSYRQRITKDLGVRCKRPKLELLHGEDYEEGKKRVENYKQIASALKKRES
jgi:hypothetical protein